MERGTRGSRAIPPRGGKVHDAATWSCALSSAEIQEIVAGGSAEHSLDTNSGSYASAGDLVPFPVDLGAGIADNQQSRQAGRK